MRRALHEYVISGIKTTLPFFSWLLAQEEFANGRFHTAYLDAVLDDRQGRRSSNPCRAGRTCGDCGGRPLDAVADAVRRARAVGQRAALEVSARAEGLRE